MKRTGFFEYGNEYAYEYEYDQGIAEIVGIAALFWMKKLPDLSNTENGASEGADRADVLNPGRLGVLLSEIGSGRRIGCNACGYES